MSQLAKIVGEIKDPPREFSPIPFWFLNDGFEDAEIIRQLEEFNKKGVHGVVLHPRIGVPESIEYLSDTYMRYMKTAIETAARLDMKIVLYDEAMYPSGSAHGLVVKENPKFASQGLFLSDSAEEGRLIAETPHGKYLIQKPTGGRIRGIHFGEDDGEANAPMASDLLSAEAVETFIKLTHERYYQWFAPYFGNTVIGFFTDEPALLGRIGNPRCHAWTWGFENVIEEAGGSLPLLEGLFTGEENETVALYKKLVFQRECENYYRHLSEWCIAHGIALMGHPHRGDDIECEKYFGIPGQDVVLRFVAPEKGAIEGPESAQAKCSADAARIFGARRNSNECYGACNRQNIPWYFKGEDLKWYTDWLGVRGVNFYIPHAFYYSVEGKRKDERPPDVGPNSIWWEHFDVIADYIKRISYIMTDSRNTARVAVMCENRKMPTDEIKYLYQNQIEFNYVPYNFVPAGAYRDGKLRIGNNVYEYVCNDYKGLFSELKQVESEKDLAWRTVYTKDGVPDLRVSAIVKNGVKMWFLVNEGEEDIKTEIATEGTGTWIKADLWRDRWVRAMGRKEEEKNWLSLQLKRRESLLLLLDEEGSFAETLPMEKEKQYLSVSFRLVKHDTALYCKYYEGSYQGKGDDLYLALRAEEMTECYVNGKLCGFSLWSPHEFYLSPYLKDGDNRIELRVTGSAANRFGKHQISYGLQSIDERIFSFIYGCALGDAVQRNAYPHKTDWTDSVNEKGIFIRKKNERKGYINTPKNKLAYTYPAAVDEVERFACRVLFGKPFADQGEYDDCFCDCARKVRAHMKKGAYCEFTFGNVQKLINMVMKHLYTGSYGDPDIRVRFRYCHCPVDSQIARRLIQIQFDKPNNPDLFTKRKQKSGEIEDSETLNLNQYCKKFKTPPSSFWLMVDDIAKSVTGKTWSLMDTEKDIENYLKIQEKIREIRKTDPMRYGVNALEFDCFIWQLAGEEEEI